VKPAELLKLFRQEANDLASPPLWSDAEVYGYMTAAQEMFCRLTRGIQDSTSEITQISVITDDPYVEYDSRILRIRDARLESTGAKVTILNPEDLEQGSLLDDYGLVTGRFDLTLTGTPRYLLLGVDDFRGRLIKIPEADDTLQLTVERLPLLDKDLDASQSLEIHPQHHRYLTAWMLHLAHQKQDAEAYNRGRSAEFGERFQSYCELAKREQERRQHKQRNVSYGGY
jgi:hypothetical protein